MRITRDILLKLAQENVNRRVRANREIVAVYLCGSVLEEEYLLGGTLDVDLVFIHYDQPPAEREIIPLSDDAHLDISHQLQIDYRQPRSLRDRPWLGPTINNCKALHDPQHFIDFTQASVRGNYDRPNHVLHRARKSYEQARQIWLNLQVNQQQPGQPELASYLRAVWHAANAITSLSGAPLTERRFLLKFPTCAAAIDRPGLYPGLLGLLGAPNLNPEILWGWLALWQTAYRSLPESACPPRLHPHRFSYYHKAFEAIMGSAQPIAVLWPVLRTWTLAAGSLAPTSDERRDWFAAMQQAGLLGETFNDKLAALDAYLDLIDETLEEWGTTQGA